MRFIHFLLISTALFLQSFAFAQQNADLEYSADTGRTTISGFATLGGVYNADKNISFRRTVDQESKQRSFSLIPDSRFGVQISHRVSSQLEMVGQMVLRDQIDNSLEKSVSRAFFAYDFTPAIRVRLGRIGDSTYLMSDYQDVGYAYPWVRPPEPTYTILPVHNFDGADVRYSINDADTNWQVKVLAGKIKSHISSSYVLESKGPMLGAALIREQGALKTWLGHMTLKLAKNHSGEEFASATQNLNLLANTPLLPTPFPPYGIPNPYIADARQLLNEIYTEGKRASYSSVGLTFDNGGWMLQSELSKMTSDVRSFRVKQGYISVGRHFGNLMPYALVGFVRGDKFKKSSNWSLSPILGNLQNQTIEAINSTLLNENHYSLGLRWDLHQQAALKFQWNKLRAKDLSQNDKPLRSETYSVALDFVF